MSRSILENFPSILNKTIILASGSPRRKEILATMGFKNVIVRPSSFAEDLDKTDLSPQEYCLKTCTAKGLEVVRKMIDAGDHFDILISSDTIVEFDGRILEKPGTNEEAYDMLKIMSGAANQVHTAVAIFVKGQAEPVKGFVSTAKVWFGDLSDEEINGYIATGEPFDKAGGYGIQSLGGHLVDRIEGDFYTVMGLPYRMLSVAVKELITEGRIEA